MGLRNPTFGRFAKIVFLVLAFVLPGHSYNAQNAESTSTPDMPDDFEGPQIHVIYAIPSDRPDATAEFIGQLRNEIDVSQQWVQAEVGRLLKFDTFQGEPDITIVRLTRTEQEIYDLGASEGYVSLESELKFRDEYDPDKLYAVFFDGGFNDFKCGGLGAGGAIALTILGGSNLCGTELSPRANGSGQLHPLSYAATMMHEVIHTLGFVPTCAPDHNDNSPGHLKARSDDIMKLSSEFESMSLDKH